MINENLQTRIIGEYDVAVTGQAAGTAAALTDDFSSIDIDILQKTLVKDGVFLHEKDIK